MKIADTCPCGSTFTCDDGDGPSAGIYARSEHEKWIETHAPCRDAWLMSVRR